MRTSIVRLTAAPKGRGEVISDPADSLELAGGPQRLPAVPRGRIQADHTHHEPVDCGPSAALPAWPWWRAAAVDRGDAYAGSSWIGDRVGTSAGERPYTLRESSEYKPAGRYRGVWPRGGALLAAHGCSPSRGAVAVQANGRTVDGGVRRWSKLSRARREHTGEGQRRHRQFTRLHMHSVVEALLAVPFLGRANLAHTGGP
jgi:hypothetical protein